MAPPPLARAADPKSAPVASPAIDSLRLGFNGVFKLGCWTQVEVTVTAGDQPIAGVIEVTAPDPDGIPVAATTSPAAPLQLAAGQTATAALTIRVGQEGAPLTVRLRDDAGATLAARTFTPRRPSSTATSAASFAAGLPATDKLVVTYGARADLAAELARAEVDAAPTAAGVRSVLVTAAADLPLEWFGYEGVDAVILSGSQLKAYADAAALAPRIAALNRWVELGGRLVIFCGAGSAELLAADAPLAPLVPGRYEGEIVPLPSAAPLEIFSNAANQIRRTDERVTVPRLLDPQGTLLAQGPSAVPIVIRARRGLGEITFVAVDPDADPLAKWGDRTNLLRQSLRWPAPAPNSAIDRGAGPATADLLNQLRTALDQQFVGVATVPFALVALLVIGYIALVGPGDYFLLRWIKRPQLTWLTVPLLVAGSCAGAYALAYRMKGDELCVNQVEIIDVDVAAGTARGTVWTHLFNPNVTRYDLSLKPRFAGNSLSEPGRPDPGAPSDLQPKAYSLKPASSATLASWLGVPGFGLGAMQGTRGQPPLFDEGYAFDSERNAMIGLPIEQWSTKSLTARWSASVGPTIESDLRALGDDQLVGQLANRTGVRLEDCILIRGGWAYQLAPLDPGATAMIDNKLVARTLRTTLTSRAAGDDRTARTADDGSVLYDTLSTDVARIVKLMMFYEAVGGAAYAGTPNRYQSFIDMSRLLAGDQAILLARAPAEAGSTWIEGDTQASRPLASNHDRHWNYCRFVLPLTPTNEPPRPERPVFGPSAVPTR